MINFLINIVDVISIVAIGLMTFWLIVQTFNLSTLSHNFIVSFKAALLSLVVFLCLKLPQRFSGDEANIIDLGRDFSIALILCLLIIGIVKTLRKS